MTKLERLKNGELEIDTKNGKKVIKGKLFEKNGKTFFKIKAKKVYFNNRYPFRPKLKLTDKQVCLHCEKEFFVGDYQILIENNKEYIVCPNAPECDGTLIDWMDVHPVKPVLPFSHTFLKKNI